MTKETIIMGDDLRALLFWASVGVSKSCGGSYENSIIEIIENYAEYLGFYLDIKPRFRKRSASKIIHKTRRKYDNRTTN